VRHLEGHSGTVAALAVSPDGKIVASGGADGAVRLWEIASGKELARIEGEGGGIKALAFSPDAKTLLSAASDGTLGLWDVASGKSLRHFRGARDALNSIAFSPDGKRVAGGAENGSVFCYDLASGKMVYRAEVSPHKVRSVSYSPDGQYLLVCTPSTVLLFEAATGKQIHALDGMGDKLLTAVFSADGRRIMTLATEGTVFVSQEMDKFAKPFKEEQGSQAALGSFSPDGRLALTALDSSVRLREMDRGKEVQALTTQQRVASLAFSPSGDTVAIGDAGGTIYLLRVSSRGAGKGGS
jgi:WD40 repeat protein